MTYLLDVNVLIALIDPNHVSHNVAHEWFETHGHLDWATCPLTQNGVIRIVGHPKYPNSPGSPALVADMVTQLKTLSGHVFWPDDISLTDRAYIDTSHLLSSAQVTDSYLLALAKSKGGQLVTFDRRLVTTAVKEGKAALLIIGHKQ